VFFIVIFLGCPLSIDLWPALKRGPNLATTCLEGMRYFWQAQSGTVGRRAAMRAKQRQQNV
jgi:hypothetical protein